MNKHKHLCYVQLVHLTEKYEEEIEIKGHLIDSMILTRIFDSIMDLKGDFQVLDFNIGKKKKDVSYARLTVRGKSRAHLRQLMESLYREGAQPVTIQDKGTWIEVENMMMDKCIVVDKDEKRAGCKMIRDLKKGDLVVVGDQGVKIIPQERPREGVDIFQFMGSSSSSERPTQQIARKIAIDIHNTKKTRGRIIVVAGPVLVHSGGADALAKLIRMGYVHGLLAGNALAVHDVENALMGTSLGMNIKDGALAVLGHRNHMQAINEVFKAGSLNAMVRKRTLKRGVMYECIANDIPFVLAGSVRDDGPIPDVITDIVEAQRKYKQVLEGAKMVLMLSTMLHSIAVGNMLPSSVKVVAVDISQPVVTKLIDRGTIQAIGIVTDVGSFLPTIVQHLENFEKTMSKKASD
jgi:lysine-ketoglutarate reductase/saccharopine dehydrogenase-like protein (TIGR00300 family)